MKKIILETNEEIDVEDIIRISKEAGKVIMEIYGGDFYISEKQDNSPLTEADLGAHEVIVRSLNELYPEIPVLSEESKGIDYEKRKGWKYFWLVDPLDGTKDFIKRGGDFTVNIALIHKDKPAIGVVYVPVKDILYYGDKVNGSFKRVGSEENKLPIERERDNFVVIASKSHFSKETEEFIETLRENHENLELNNVGSSIKLCIVAEGAADIYPRLGPTSEWDTAAAHAVVKFAGKKVLDFNTKEEIKYNKVNILNPWFVVE